MEVHQHGYSSRARDREGPLRGAARVVVQEPDAVPLYELHTFAQKQHVTAEIEMRPHTPEEDTESVLVDGQAQGRDFPRQAWRVAPHHGAEAIPIQGPEQIQQGAFAAANPIVAGMHKQNRCPHKLAMSGAVNRVQLWYVGAI